MRQPAHVLRCAGWLVLGRSRLGFSSIALQSLVDALRAAQWQPSMNNPSLVQRHWSVWGREVNLLLLGLAKQILAAFESPGELKDHELGPYVRELKIALYKMLDAVEASGLKHNELWSYRIVDGKLLPVRYGSTSDIQLWNLTDLALQFLLARIAVI